MKRLICAILVLLIMNSWTIGWAVAEDIDLSNLSFDQLVALKDRINLAIWNSDEWQEVVVPQGLWVVGEDIPAGHWTVEPYPKCKSLVSIGDTLTEDGQKVLSYTDRFFDAFIVSPEYQGYKQGEHKTSFDFEFKNGDYVYISSGDVIFKPYSGKPSLGFK